jgi:hypothetical protein
MILMVSIESRRCSQQIFAVLRVSGRLYDPIRNITSWDLVYLIAASVFLVDTLYDYDCCVHIILYIPYSGVLSRIILYIA